MAKINNYKLFYFIQACLKYWPFRNGIKIRRFFYRPFFNYLGKGVIIQDNVLFKFPSDITLGDRVQIAQNSIIVGGSGLDIGADVLIGAGTKITTSSHNYSSTAISIYQQGLSYKPIKIESDVWFGFNVVILGGVHIGKGVVIGANSLVKNDIPDYAVIGGIPAEILKMRI